MNWAEIVSTVLEKDADKVMLAPLSNIAGADIKFDKGYGTIKINVPADVADNLTNGSGKYVGGLLLIDRRSYEEAKGGIEPRKPQTNADRIRAMSDEEWA